MKNNTDNARKLLQNAFKAIPNDFALSEVRYHVQQALSKLTKVEENHAKKEVKKNFAQDWNEMLKNGVQNPHTSGRTVDIINQMIGEENRKLEAILRKREEDMKKNTPIKDD